jgi:hypothetical protein
MVYENQRWWMGLDWTAALLPGDRPSWCSASQAAFALPAPTTAFLPVNGPPDACEQRTATWAWAEPEWRVVVRRDGYSSVDTVEGAENTTEETDADTSASEWDIRYFRYRDTTDVSRSKVWLFLQARPKRRRQEARRRMLQLLQKGPRYPTI